MSRLRIGIALAVMFLWTATAQADPQSPYDEQSPAAASQPTAANANAQPTVDPDSAQAEAIVHAWAEKALGRTPTGAVPEHRIIHGASELPSLKPGCSLGPEVRDDHGWVHRRETCTNLGSPQGVPTS